MHKENFQNQPLRRAMEKCNAFFYSLQIKYSGWYVQDTILSSSSFLMLINANANAYLALFSFITVVLCELFRIVYISAYDLIRFIHSFFVIICLQIIQYNNNSLGHLVID